MYFDLLDLHYYFFQIQHHILLEHTLYAHRWLVASKAKFYHFHIKYRIQLSEHIYLTLSHLKDYYLPKLEILSNIWKWLNKI